MVHCYVECLGLDATARGKLEILINAQIKQVLDKIEEEGQSDEDLCSPDKKI